jgi:hypothetical protein
MKNKDLPKIIIIAIVILFVIPLLINLSFKIGSIRLLAAEWTAGDLLSFYGAVLGALITLIGLVITLDYQSKQARKDDDVKYRPILKIIEVKRGTQKLDDIELIGEEELRISFPGLDGSNYGYNGNGNFRKFKIVLKNKGRGEATNVYLDAAYVKNASWDEDIHLDFSTSFPVSLGEVLVGESLVFNISVPEHMFLKEMFTENLVSIELVISYDNIFHRNRTTIKGLFTFIIRGSEIYEASYDYKPDFQFMRATWDYLKFQQIEEATSEH